MPNFCVDSAFAIQQALLQHTKFWNFHLHPLPYAMPGPNFDHVKAYLTGMFIWAVFEIFLRRIITAKKKHQNPSALPRKCSGFESYSGFSSFRGHQTMLYSFLTNARECSMKKLYVYWIVEKADMNEWSNAIHKQTKKPGKGKFIVTKY
jgi:hypothetical protein